MQGATLCPLGLDGDKSKYLQNFNVEIVRNLLLGIQTRKWKRCSLFWEITQPIAAVPYGRFGTTSVPSSRFNTRLPDEEWSRKR